METWTINRLLTWITGYLARKAVDSPRFSAELLLSEVLARPRIELYTHFDQVVPDSDLERLRDLVRRAGEHEPVAYLVGWTEFYSLRIEVCRDCLIPRPETELLVQRAIEFVRSRPGPQSLLDLGTGSGCIAIAVAVNCSRASCLATDICDRALAVAARNIQLHGLTDQVILAKGDLFEPVRTTGEGPFDLIVSNPPYVASDEFEVLDRSVRDYEPRLALDGGPDGLMYIRQIVSQSGQLLRPDGTLMLEIGYRQGKQVCELLQGNGAFARVELFKDSQGWDRIVVAHRCTGSS